MHADKIVPIFRSFDEAKAKEFYVDFLGFVVDWEHRFDAGAPLYFAASRFGATLHLSEHHGDCAPGAKAIIEMTGLAAFHAELCGKSYRGARPGLEPWIGGGAVVAVTDPFHNKLDFVEPARSRS